MTKSYHFLRLLMVFLLRHNAIAATDNAPEQQQYLRRTRSNICRLCADGLGSLKYPNAVILPNGMTCLQMALDTSMGFNRDTPACKEQIEAWRQICCGDDRPIDVNITEPMDLYWKPPNKNSIKYKGPNKKCDVCHDGKYPGAEGMVIHLLYLGAGTCPQYWQAGLEGAIPNHMCAPLQFFAGETCGCSAKDRGEESPEPSLRSQEEVDKEGDDGGDGDSGGVVIDNNKEEEKDDNDNDSQESQPEADQSSNGGWIKKIWGVVQSLLN